MKKLLIGLMVGLITGAALGFATGIFVYPFWFLNDVASETLSRPEGQVQVAHGTFTHANPSDPIHWGKGNVSIFRRPDGQQVVHLEESFEVGPGPRFHLYLVDRAKIMENADFEAAGNVDLGRLRAFKGSQVYSIPDGADLGKYQSVVVWCKEFNVLISPATLDKKSPSG